ncbi:RnfABCDGE type electron transport complex subunit D [Clostridium thermarum]|uniref:RnfABCDGE type electron transport complex subunit D n=1 Tax=Clostridium thermarum TaxID=1716543 RepID=UPI0013D81C6C|nr:RnfABCDGE type electron transport complex subunit D [Clostridium thermarum]
MIDVLIALLPVIVAGMYFYGFSTLGVIAVGAVASVIAEAVFNVIVKRKQTIKDLSAVVTGIIVALILPPYIPLWVVAVGSIFATVVVKLFFGGLGNNFMNPAGAAKAFIIASWAATMIKPSDFSAERTAPVFDSKLLSMIVGQVKGNIGEVSIAAILLGGLYLVIRRKISIVTPLTAILSSAAMAALLGYDVQSKVLVGSLFFAAVFMAGEPYTTPKSALAQAIFGLGFGIVSMIIMILGYNSEGPYYAVIILNLFTPVIDHFTSKKTVKEAAK